MSAEIARLQQLAATSQIGGKGSIRRPRKVQHKTPVVEDRQLTQLLRRFGVGPIPETEEVNIFMEDGKVLHFANPKLQAAIQNQVYVVSGKHEIKRAEDLQAQSSAAMLEDLLARVGKGIPAMDA